MTDPDPEKVRSMFSAFGWRAGPTRKNRKEQQMGTKHDEQVDKEVAEANGEVEFLVTLKLVGTARSIADVNDENAAQAAWDALEDENGVKVNVAETDVMKKKEDE